MPIIQSALPYDHAALEPHVSAKTMSFHYDKHHRGYVDKLNAGIKNTPYDDLTLEQVIDRARERGDIDILNNALQAWNHGFLWESMSSNGGAKPEGRILQMIKRDFGSIDTFRDAFRDAALGVFGSGWAWLVVDMGKLSIITTGNADSPVGTRLTPLLTLDVWEHAYYLDYQNERKRYVDAFLSNLINWEFAGRNLDRADLNVAA